jgi:hypothetical protein
MWKKKDIEYKAKKDLVDRVKTSWDCWEAHKKISYKGEVDEHGIDTTICGKDQLMSVEEWELVLKNIQLLYFRVRLEKSN